MLWYVFNLLYANSICKRNPYLLQVVNPLSEKQSKDIIATIVSVSLYGVYHSM